MQALLTRGLAFQAAHASMQSWNVGVMISKMSFPTISSPQYNVYFSRPDCVSYVERLLFGQPEYAILVPTGPHISVTELGLGFDVGDDEADELLVEEEVVLVLLLLDNVGHAVIAAAELAFRLARHEVFAFLTAMVPPTPPPTAPAITSTIIAQRRKKVVARRPKIWRGSEGLLC